MVHGVRRDLSVEQEYRLAFGEAGIVPPLVGLLDSPDKGVSVRAAEALRYLAEEDALREAIRLFQHCLTVVQLVCYRVWPSLRFPLSV